MKAPLPLLFALLLAGSTLLAADANRLTYLDDPSPFWPKPDSPRLTTPQWVGEPGVEAVVILAIDDMRDPAKYEAFLRPILNRLKQIDGRAPLSIMTNTVKPDDPQFAAWLREGVSIESHTLTHPCPLLGPAGFAEAARTVHGSIDLLSRIAGSAPVVFRMPCCDSMNSASPRFFSEILRRPSAEGRRLKGDSSVFTRPRGERFQKYFPAEMHPPMKLSLGDYAGFIDDYPYPYTVANEVWEFPCTVPSDWEAFNVLGPKSPVMLSDWKAALDEVVRRQGLFTAVFHPHGWSAPEQWVDFIEYAQQTYGPKVKFLSFREAVERLEKHALAGHSLQQEPARLLDLDGDGRMDVVTNAATRVWDANAGKWVETGTPFRIEEAEFGIVRDGAVSAVAKAQAWTWRAGAWQPDAELSAGLDLVPEQGRRLRDCGATGACDLLANRDIFTWSAKERRWQAADFALPEGCAVLDAQGRDNGLRFADLNGDGFDDVIQSNGAGYRIYLWAGIVKANLGWKRGWPHLVADGPAAADPAKARVLPFVRDGQDNGAWFHHDSVVWQNETIGTKLAPSITRSFKELIAFDVPPPLSPEDSLASMQPVDGFTVELVAAEPVVQSPCYLDWDAQGRLWVVEMRDYPLGMDGHGKPGGVVKMLSSSRRDGHYDQATVFLKDLPYPNSLMPWRDGLLIAAAPDIFFAADRHGAGQADERRVLFTGFKEGNQQHRVNGFDWGLDGWIYGANGNSGGEVTSLARPGEKPVSIAGRDFRFRPDTGELEPESGQAQYGRRRDDWGHWFGNDNSTWLWHYPLADAYLRRNPKLAVKSTRQVLANYPDPTLVFPISELPIRFNQPQSAGHLTSGCSVTPYRDELFGPGYEQSVFMSEPVHNVVHREVLTPKGASFTSARAESERDREFLASRDPWFRPTTTKVGPDGALYIADFYRFVLEHPEWIAPETQSRLDLRAGADRGRIYRVYPKGAQLRPPPNLAQLDNAALAAALDSPNGWQRDTVQRLLYERNAQETAPALRKLAGSAANSKVRVQALAALGTLGALDPATVRAGLQDAHPEVRQQALRGSEALPAADVVENVAALVDDPEAAVRHQLALTLGAFHDERALGALAKLAERDAGELPMRIAIESSLAPDSALFKRLNAMNAPAAAPKIELPKPSTPDRARVVASYAGVAALKGDPRRGHELFLQQCFLCHRLKGEGHEVGPDLGMVNDKPVDWLLTAILDPNAAVEERYKSQSVKLRTGEEILGIVSVETANNIVLRLPGGADYPVLRSDIAVRRPTGKSLMPDGLETVFKPQDIADIIAWLRAP